MDDVTARWLGRAHAEDASADVFEEMADRLVAIDPGPAFVSLADRLRAAARDERRHAVLCRAMVPQVADAHAPPPALAVPPVGGLDDATRLASEFVYLLAAGETVAIALLSEARKPPCLHAIAATLDGIEADERRHAQLGWDLLDALLPHMGSDKALTARALSQQAVRVVFAATSSAPDDGDLRAWGVLSREHTHDLAMTTIVRQVAPELIRRGLWAAPTSADR